ncbi:MAG: DegT/DnrJ/EryC1/StrS family aminotransferase [Candidatus Micrarchaeota archaeon]|nr:DegT/DnrJ/EryC1/StrS family aminotransferase [Candidatus Micrarchaeota archaeon]
MDKIRMVDVRLGDEELQNITNAVKTSWISSKGAYLEEFEKGFSSYIGTKHGIATTNGTTAIHLALVALGIKKGDEVLVPTFTHISNAFTVTYTGAKPVFMDSHADYWCIDPQKIEDKITSKTKAIVLVHIYGHPCDMDPIMEIANRHGLPVIEDCAEAHGAEYKSRKVGTFGTINCFSFYGNKIITTGEGGMCLTNDEELAARMRMLKDMGINPNNPTKKKYWFEIVGYNYRMTNLQAAIGAAQVKRLDDMVEKRRWVASTYNKFLKDAPGVVTHPEMAWAKNVYWYYTILVEKRKRDKLIDDLEARNIESRPAFYPIHKLPVYRKRENLPVAADLGARGINLPSGPSLTEEQIAYIVDAIKESLK